MTNDSTPVLLAHLASIAQQQEIAALLVDSIYQIVRNTARVEYSTETRVVIKPKPGSFATLEVAVAVLQNVRRSSPVGNDTLVSIPSGAGKGTFGAVVQKNCAIFVGGNGIPDLELGGVSPSCFVIANDGRNHSSVANAPVARRVVDWLLEAERERGDLR